MPTWVNFESIESEVKRPWALRFFGSVSLIWLLMLSAASPLDPQGEKTATPVLAVTR
jgi:hypothetical protein